LYKPSLAIYEAKLGKGHPQVATCLNNLARLCQGVGRSKEAAALVDRARRGTRRHVARVLPALSEAEQAWPKGRAGPRRCGRRS
jgi:hypothetical protein